MSALYTHRTDYCPLDDARIDALLAALTPLRGQLIAGEYAGARPLLDTALPEFERILIRVALQRTQGHRQDAARLLGWGRNTLTRKLKELGMSDIDEAV